MQISYCLFCDIQNSKQERIISENSLAYAIRDAFPVTEGHTLLIPKRHSLSYFELLNSEVIAINDLILEQRKILLEIDRTIRGFNIGINCGEVAGQSVLHCHAHLIPRRKGDVQNPKGGVRHIIPNKGYYEDLNNLTQ